MTKRFHMKILQAVLLVFSLLSFWGCTATSSETASASFDVKSLFAQLPADNNIQRDLLMQALLSLDEKKLLEASRFLESQDIDLRNQAEYAFHGMALYVGQTENKNHHKKYIAVIGGSLKEEFSVKNRIFLLQQLQYIPGDNAVTVAAAYLTDDILAEISVMVLQSKHSSKAAEALMEALDNVSGNLQSAIVSALAEMKQREAAAKMFNLLPSDNRILEISVLRALAKLAYLPAEESIRNFITEHKEQSALLLLWGQSLAAYGEKRKSEAVFREIFENKSTLFNNAQRSAALTGLNDLLKEKAFDDILNAFNEESKAIRAAALKLALLYQSGEYIQKWIELAGAESSDQKIEIIDFLGRIKNESAMSWLRDRLKDEDVSSRARALHALAEIDGSGIETDLKEVLQTDLQDELSVEAKNILLQMSDSLALSRIIMAFDSYSISAKKLIIEVIAERQLISLSDVLIKQLTLENAELKNAALDGLAVLAAAEHFKELLGFYLDNSDTGLQGKYVKAVAACFDDGQHGQFLLGFFDTSSENEKQKLLKIFGELGGKTFYQKSLQFASKNTYGQEILLKWPDAYALPFLLQTARTSKNESEQIQAIRSAVLILRKGNLTKDQIVSYCADFFEVSSRAEEKRLVLSVLAEIKNDSSLELLVQKLDDPDIQFNVFLALLDWAESNFSDIRDNRTEDLIVNLLKGRISDSLDARMAQYRTEKFQASPPEGFSALFNGLDLSGWKGLVANPAKRAQMTADELHLAQERADSIMRACWSVLDGMLFFNGQGFPNICTIKDYQNFEMFVDWKIEEDGDSGIYLRGVPQVQIWDPAYNSVGSGGLFNNKTNISVPLQIADKPVGEWNTFHIIMKGQRVTVFLNDIKVVDNTILENYWERDKDLYRRGQIELQAHRNPLYFKNIFIKELPSEPALFNGVLFNGKDLSGWQVIDNPDNSWNAVDGILFCEGQGAGWLSTEEEYDNFELQLEFRLPEGGNSGVFIRAPHKGDPAYSGMEIQLLDDYSSKYSDLKEWQYTGSIYGIQAPDKRVSAKANTWQKMIIRCEGPAIKVLLNDKEIINSSLTKFGYAAKEHPGIKRRAGFIGLQNHNSRVEFRNIFLTELP